LQITRVELKNIKNHAQAAWSFSPGVIAICGPNGSGKTTILEAIAWALFDHLDYKREDFLKRGENRGQVVITFISDLDGREYQVHRDTGGGYFVSDPDTQQRVTEQKNQVVQWLRLHMGVEPGTDLSSLFKSTIGVPQGTFTFDFTLPPGRRKQVFDQILKVEEYRDASEALRDSLRLIESRLGETERGIAQAEGEMTGSEEIEKEHSTTRARLERLSEEHSAGIVAIERLASEAAALEDLRRAADASRLTIERLMMRLESTRDTFHRAGEALEKARSARSVLEAAGAGHKSYLEASRRLDELERLRTARDQARTRATAAEREMQAAIGQVDRCNERLNEISLAEAEVRRLGPLAEQQIVIEARLAELREQRGARQAHLHAMEILDQELIKLRTRYAELARQLERAEAEREAAQNAANLEEESARLDAEIAEKSRLASSYQSRRELLDSLNVEIERLQAARAANQRERTRLAELLSKAERASEVEKEYLNETDRLAKLRAEVARDTEMINGLERGGLCPLLSERCLNLKPGESLDSRFRAGLAERRGEITKAAKELTALAEAAQSARRAVLETSRLPTLLEEDRKIEAELSVRTERIAAHKIELERADGLAESALADLKTRREQNESQLRRARQAQRIYDQASWLTGELEEIKREGSSKRQEWDRLSALAGEANEVESLLAGTEAELAALGDPRGRTVQLNQIIASRAERYRETEQANSLVSRAESRLSHARTALEEFSQLDSQIAEENLVKAASELDYTRYIAHEQEALSVEGRQHDLAALNEEIAKTEALLETSSATLAGLEARYDAQYHRRLEGELEARRHRVTQLATQIEHSSQQALRLSERLEYLAKIREAWLERQTSRDRDKRLYEVVDFLRDVLLKAAPFITESYVYSISLEANQLFREITGRQDLTLRWSKDYEVLVEEASLERPFANLSGGEQMAAALAVRLALLKEMSEINLAFFDEPTTNMDAERRQNLARQIGRVKDFHQLFVISHDDTFEGYTGQTVSLDG
jgi:exonuclease SbcC